MSHGDERDERRKERLLELGSRVRARREELGLSVQQVSEKTKIRSKYLIAVEEGDDSVSPGRTYFRAFLKTYASFLGLDGSALSAEYRDIVTEAETAQPGRPRESRPRPQDTARPAPQQGVKTGQGTVTAPSPDAQRPSRTPAAVSHTTPGQDFLAAAPPSTYSAPRPRRRRTPGERRRKGGAIWALLAIAVIAAAAYYMVEIRPNSPLDPETIGGREPSEPTGGEPVPGADPEQDPGDPGDDPIAEPPKPIVTREDPNQEKTVWSVDRTPIEMELRLHEESDSYCWVSVYVDGEYSFERTLAPGEVVSVTGDSEISIRAGKPWVMDIVINGQEMGPGGEFGPVKDLVVRSTVSPE